ncbi:MAG: helix-turn-helix transcriptional regulator [Bacteroidales bacterium]|jgi:transcriptional regulator with XRE-family HTH domain|nr:helix-turn-helix transcriptional regulator [Bacteroidales bacterium]MDI9593178.1 helix-turn-helix transcriptional regulator [Bacteroidota bacterium]NLH32683.1 helix-turn-helix domain-containing protein [Lentimicrobium sp.]OQC37480.1 MAG: Helix-turn-helix domain protein [Bacteroidetes bacterium ADurb.Bin041]MBP7875183.1 helix-turn-helix transcriptional regulator [Bacteroidales bacterium]
MSSIFGDKLKALRGKKQIPQRKVASILEIDTATYCKIENGDRKAKREQISILADLFKTDEKELFQLWSADRIYEIIAKEKDAKQILNVVSESINIYVNQKPKV